MENKNIRPTATKRRKNVELCVNTAEKENLNAIIHSESAPSFEFTQIHQQAAIAEMIRKQDQVLEAATNRYTAVKRGQKAGEVFRVKQAQKNESKQKLLQAKQNSLGIEKRRANFVAGLPPPVKDSVDELLERYKAIEIRDSECLIPTLYIPEVNLVQKASPSKKKPNAQSDAIVISEFEQAERELKKKQSEEHTDKTNQRFGVAIQKEKIKNSYRDVLMELGEVDRLNKRMKQKELYSTASQFVKPIKQNDKASSEREKELEMAVEKIMQESNDCFNEYPIANVTIRSKKSKSQFINNSECNTPLPKPNDNDSFQDMLSVLRKEREETMFRIRANSPGLQKTQITPFKVEMPKHYFSRLEHRNEPCSNKVKAVEQSPYLNEKELNCFNEEKKIVTIGTQTITTSEDSKSAKSSHLSVFSLSTKINKISPNSSLNDTSVNKNTQTDDMIELYQQELIQRAKNKSSCQSIKTKDQTTKTQISGYLKNIVEKHLQQTKQEINNTPVDDDHTRVKRTFFTPIGIQTDDQLEKTNSTEKPSFESFNSHKNPHLRRQIFSQIEKIELSSSLLTKNEEKMSKMSSASKFADCIVSEKVGTQQSTEKSQLTNVGITKVSGTLIEPVSNINITKLPEKIETVRESLKINKNCKMDRLDSRDNETKSTTSCSASSTSLSDSSQSRNSSLSLLNLSSSSTSSSDLRHIPNYIQHRIMSDHSRRHLSSKPIETLEELHEILAALLPPGDDLEHYIHPKPPISYPCWVQDPLVPHELSTIQEVDTPQNSITDGFNVSKNLASPKFPLKMTPVEKRNAISRLLNLSPYTCKLPSSDFTNKDPSRSSISSEDESIKWGDILKLNTPSVLPNVKSTSSSISSLSSGLCEAFVPGHIKSHSTPIKNNSMESKDVSSDDLELMQITLIGPELTITEEERFDERTKNLSSMSTVKTFSNFPYSIASTASPFNPTLASIKSVSHSSPSLISHLSPATQSSPILSDSMASFLKHEQNAMLSQTIYKDF